MSDKTTGKFAVPTRVFLTAEQREKLFVMARDQGIDLPDLLTELLTSFLDHLPEQQAAAAEEPAAEEPADIAQQIRSRRAEIRRLRARATIGGDAMPPWLHGYIAQLESELRRLEGQ
jgi:hypothetical protein